MSKKKQNQPAGDAADKAPMPEPVSSVNVPPPEDQAQRRVKYGANVVLASALVIVLAVMIVWLGQTPDIKLFGKHISLRARPDLTANGSNSLKPQTISIVRDLPGKITLVSLYPKLKEDERREKEDTYDRVLNVLEQYHRYNPDKIDVLTIDPITEPAKLDAWIGRLKRDYGQNMSEYDDLLRGFPKTLEQIRKVATDQNKEMHKLSESFGGADMTGLTDDQKDRIVNTVNVTFVTMQRFPPMLTAMDEGIHTELDKKIPDYEAAKNQLVSQLEQLSKLSETLSSALKQLQDEKTTPEKVRQYTATAVPALGDLKKLADGTIEKAKKLGKLKLDEVRRKLIPPDDTKTPPPAIVVMGKDDIRVIDFDSVWSTGDANAMAAPNEKPRLRFAGEQRITFSILALSEPTQKTIAIVRDGGSPLAQSAPQGMEDEQGSGPLADIADRMRSYNYSVVEKDLSGKYQQQSMQMMQMGRMPVPEPNDEELKGAIWVVFPMPGDPRQRSSSTVLSQRLRQHLQPQPVGSDLAVDEKDPLLVRSAFHPFVNPDVGRALEISAAPGWTPGRYKIVAIKSGSAQLERSPAGMNSTGGIWEELPGVDLTIVSADEKTVKSTTHNFSPVDRGDILRIKGENGWKAGRYKITDVKGDTAVLDAAPGATGLKDGAWDVAPGSAICFTSMGGDDLGTALTDYGIHVRNDAIILHEAIQSSAGAGGDFVEQARRVPFIFVLNQYGDHPIAKPINALDCAARLAMPVEKSPTPIPGVNVSMLLPIPQSPKSWGETNLDFMTTRGAAQPTFDEKDITGPLWAGAVGEKQGAGRVVVLGGYSWMFNDLLRLTDPKMEKQHLAVARFPGNGELFSNAIFWLAGDDQMIALSPAAMETPRIASISEGMANFWRYGVLMIGLPLAALVCGFFVYQNRRD